MDRRALANFTFLGSQNVVVCCASSVQQNGTKERKNEQMIRNCTLVSLQRYSARPIGGHCCKRCAPWCASLAQSKVVFMLHPIIQFTTVAVNVLTPYGATKNEIRENLLGPDWLKGIRFFFCGRTKSCNSWQHENEKRKSKYSGTVQKCSSAAFDQPLIFANWCQLLLRDNVNSARIWQLICM